MLDLSGEYWDAATHGVSISRGVELIVAGKSASMSGTRATRRGNILFSRRMLSLKENSPMESNATTFQWIDLYTRESSS